MKKLFLAAALISTSMCVACSGDNSTQSNKVESSVETETEISSEAESVQTTESIVLTTETETEAITETVPATETEEETEGMYTNEQGFRMGTFTLEDNITVTFSHPEEDEENMYGLFRNETDENVFITGSFGYADENGEYFGISAHEIYVPAHGEYMELFNIGEEFQMFGYDFEVGTVPSDVQSYYDSITTVDAWTNGNGSIGWKVDGTESLSCIMHIFYMDEYDNVIAADTAEWGGELPFEDDFHAPTFEYDHYKLYVNISF